LLANIMLDPMDKELKRRGLRFARYADDFLILVRSRRAAQRVMQTSRSSSKPSSSWSSTVREQGRASIRLRLPRVPNTPGKNRMDGEALKRFRERIQEITSRSRGVSMRTLLLQLRRYVVGWLNYFGISQAYREIPELDQWLRQACAVFSR